MAGLKPCGTEAAYRRHLRAGETPCLACRRANREADDRRKRAARQPETAAESLLEPTPSQPPQTRREKLESLAGKLEEAIERVLVEDPTRLPALARAYMEALDKLDAKPGEEPAEAEDELEAAFRQRGVRRRPLRVVTEG